MPTGYTAGILDGKITTFPQFAKQCMRAFGATMHMRDDEMDSEYKEAKPMDYYLENISKANQSLKDAELPDYLLLATSKSHLKDELAYYKKRVKKAKLDFENLNNILKEVNNWNPPTKEHLGIKEFMNEQIKLTINSDCETKYLDGRISTISLQLKKLNAKDIKKEMIAKAKKDLKYFNKEREKDINRCKTVNKWVSDFLNSLP